jgi:zinc protease
MLMISTKIKPVLIWLIAVLSTGLNLFAQDSTYVKEQITAKSVINKYLEAIGGADLYSKIEDRAIYFSGTSLGQYISVTIMQKAPNKLFQEVVAGVVHQKKYFDGKNGALILGDNKIEIEGNELERLQIDAPMDFLLNPQKYSVKVEYKGTEMCDSVECYKLKMILSSGNVWFQYFDAVTGLRIKETKEIQTPTGNYYQITYYNNYRNVGGLKFPFKIRQTLGAQNTVLNVDSIKINSGLSDSLFTIPEL